MHSINTFTQAKKNKKNETTNRHTGRQRERDKHTYRQQISNRQTDRNVQTDRQTKTVRHTGRTERQTDRQTEQNRQAEQNRHTSRQTDKNTKRHITQHAQTYSYIDKNPSLESKPNSIHIKIEGITNSSINLQGSIIFERE